MGCHAEHESTGRARAARRRAYSSQDRPPGLGERLEKAQQKIRECEATGQSVDNDAGEAVTIERACTAFIADAELRELQDSRLRKYRQFAKQMQTFSAAEGLRYMREWEDVELVRRFRQSWKDKGNTVVKKVERLRAFYRFARG